MQLLIYAILSTVLLEPVLALLGGYGHDITETDIRVVHHEGTLRGTPQHDVAAGPHGPVQQQADQTRRATASSPSRSEPGPIIPRQLVLTAKPATLEEMPAEVRSNVEGMLKLNPELRLRWLGDGACREFIGANFGAGLLAAFQRERRGNLRGDICRAAVLSLEGGFYMDLDVQLHVPFLQMVDNTTTFMASFSVGRAILNALLAVEPGSEVMQAVLIQIEEWYAGKRQDPETDGTTEEWMGPVTMLRGVREVMLRHCPTFHVAEDGPLQWACGPHQVLRLYEERKLNCNADYERVQDECPAPRNSSAFEGLRFGIFGPGDEGRLVAWSRFAACDAWGCHTGGWDVTDTAHHAHHAHRRHKTFGLRAHSPSPLFLRKRTGSSDPRAPLADGSRHA